jgi:hypothetical protein
MLEMQSATSVAMHGQSGSRKKMISFARMQPRGLKKRLFH